MTISSSPASASGSQAAPRSPQILGHHGTASVHLTLAVCDYDHTRDVTSGAVRADGITLTPLVFDTIEEITFRFLKNLEWDVSELSFGKYIALASHFRNAPHYYFRYFHCLLRRRGKNERRRNAASSPVASSWAALCSSLRWRSKSCQSRSTSAFLFSHGTLSSSPTLARLSWNSARSCSISSSGLYLMNM